VIRGERQDSPRRHGGHGEGEGEVKGKRNHGFARMNTDQIEVIKAKKTADCAEDADRPVGQ
jgi:hypothetical protein